MESGTAELSFESTAIDLSRLQRGQRVWKTDDPRLNHRLRRTFETADPRRRVGLRLVVKAETGSRLQVQGVAENGCQLRS
ncbi:MAG UNVERIFIED_CONTAM: DUF3656 domain-containing protein [Planctomycetaceae bacterium]